MNTSAQYDTVIAECKDVFLNKMKDYGTAWRILRPESITDQIFIKASRIRHIQQAGTQKVEDDIRSEFLGIANYAVMALIQLELQSSLDFSISVGRAEALYTHYFQQAKALMEDKNHDYDEAWREMRVSSLDDIILMKLLRIKQIEDNNGKTIVSEGLDANYLDIVNYAVFALIQMSNEM